MTRIYGRSGRNRKALFLTSTILRGRFLKNDGEQGGATGGDDIEVGAGFAEAAERLSGDDNRQPEQRGGGATQEVDDAGTGEGEGSGEGEGEADGEKKPKAKRDTAQYIRDLKRDLREERRKNAINDQRISALENSRLTPENNSANSADTSGRPDANDATKYPLGVLDDGYITDMIEWTADQKVKQVLSGERRTEQAKAEAASAEQHATALREKMDTLTEKGADQFDDFEETVVESGLRGDWKLTETTFTAAADAENGPAILYELANNKAEAQRVSQLSPFQQLKYVADRDAAIEAKKPKARTKPGAGAPPSNIPAGRNSSAPIRADTDDLNEFRKLFYKK